jgi:threonine dehydrogenase-like Zn-dependent dehydrogenase
MGNGIRQGGTMLQVAVHGVGDTRLDEVEPPDPGPGDVVVRVSACGICGSDLTYIGLGGFCVTGGPMPLGHEMSGVVEWVGPDVRGTSVGDRVAVFPGNAHDLGLDTIGNGGSEGGLTPLLLVREAGVRRGVHRIPDELPLEVGALAEPVNVGIRGVNRTGAVSGDKVAVFGCGPVGLGAIASLVDRGIDAVGIDLSPRRLELAGALGATAVLNPSEVDVWDELIRLHGREEVHGSAVPGTHAYIEVSGASKVLTEIVDHARVGACVSVVAIHHEPVPINYLTVMSKELELKGSMGYPERFDDAIDLLGRRDLSTIITHRVPLERFHDGLELVQGERDCGKVLVTIGDLD